MVTVKVVRVWIFFLDIFKLMELMDNGGRICVSRVIDGQESFAWHRERLGYHLTLSKSDTRFRSSILF